MAMITCGEYIWTSDAHFGWGINGIKTPTSCSWSTCQFSFYLLLIYTYYYIILLYFIFIFYYFIFSPIFWNPKKIFLYKAESGRREGRNLVIVSLWSSWLFFVQKASQTWPNATNINATDGYLDPHYWCGNGSRVGFGRWAFLTWGIHEPVSFPNPRPPPHHLSPINFLLERVRGKRGRRVTTVLLGIHDVRCRPPRRLESPRPAVCLSSPPPLAFINGKEHPPPWSPLPRWWGGGGGWGVGLLSLFLTASNGRCAPGGRRFSCRGS